MCNYPLSNKTKQTFCYLIQSSDDDFEEIDFGSGSEPEVNRPSY